MKGLNINKKFLKRLTIVPLLFICYVLFLNPEVILEEQCPNKPYSLTIVKHGTGIFDNKIVLIYYKINGKTVAVGNLVFFGDLGRDIDVTWDTNTDDGTHLSQELADRWTRKALVDQGAMAKQEGRQAVSIRILIIS
ncbi:hypothetical protein QFZ25_002607 [Bacillus atrophaeus]|nr:hypothetical protein [Bacillus atrophaeus]